MFGTLEDKVGGKIDPAPIPRILGHAHHTVTVRKLGLCTTQCTGEDAVLSNPFVIAEEM